MKKILSTRVLVKIGVLTTILLVFDNLYYMGQFSIDGKYG